MITKQELNRALARVGVDVEQYWALVKESKKPNDAWEFCDSPAKVLSEEAFYWDHTPQGRDYWLAIHAKLENLKEFQWKGTGLTLLQGGKIDPNDTPGIRAIRANIARSKRREDRLQSKEEQKRITKSGGF